MERIALFCQHPQAAVWQAQMTQLLPQAALIAWPEVAASSTPVRYAIVWSPTQAFFDAYPDLELVFNMGAGVDALLQLCLPPKARIVRIEDGGMAVQMAEYVCHAVIRHFREFDTYAASAAQGQWAPRAPRQRADFAVGIMGLGVLGRRVAQAVQHFGFSVRGWRRTGRADDASLPGVQCFAGDAQLGDFLSGCRIVVCMLPLTPATRGILNQRTLSQLPRGSYVINVARGAHVVEADLLALIQSGHVAGATLDVTATEPLPANHPLWAESRITLTPHISAQTVVQDAIAQMADNLARVQRGEAPTGVVDVARGY